MDQELTKELEKIKTSGNDDTPFPEYAFAISCFKLGITLEDMKTLTWVECMKMIVSNLVAMRETTPKATQDDINKLFG